MDKKTIEKLKKALIKALEEANEELEEENLLKGLTTEELMFFKSKEKDFFKRYNIKWSLRKKIASSLHSLAVKKLIGFGGFEINKKEAICHHLKACKHNPDIALTSPNFRKEAGLNVNTST